MMFLLHLFLLNLFHLIFKTIYPWDSVLLLEHHLVSQIIIMIHLRLIFNLHSILTHDLNWMTNRHDLIYNLTLMAHLALIHDHPLISALMHQMDSMTNSHYLISNLTVMTLTHLQN
jgi:hypothetical protein